MPNLKIDFVEPQPQRFGFAPTVGECRHSPTGAMPLEPAPPTHVGIRPRRRMSAVAKVAALQPILL